MEDAQRSKLRMLVAFVAAVLVLVFLSVVFFTGNAAGNAQSITLPDPNAASSDTQLPAETETGNFAVVSAENVLDVLQTIYRADAYHQIYTVYTGSNEFTSERIVALWVSGSQLHAEVESPGQIKSVLTDGTTVYLWYEDEEATVVQPADNVTTEDILGLLTYEHLIGLDPASVKAASYLLLEQSIPCIQVKTTEFGELECRYWINLETGLLYRAEIWNQSEITYTMAERSVQILAQEDAAFANRFVLPDGTSPFEN